jgi:phosphoglucomutase
MITASHNPAQDNGYKVYWSNGCQIIPPHDKKIAAAVEENLLPTCWDEELVDTSDLVEKPLEWVEEAYFKCLKGINIQREAVTGGLKFVYTPMHGVGLPFMIRAVEDLGIAKDMVIVKEQVSIPSPPFTSRDHN